MRKALPESWTPERLRKVEPTSSGRRVSMYACGYMDEIGAFSFYFGPVTTLEEALNTVPNAPPEVVMRACVVRLNLDGTNEVLYRWNCGRLKWIRKRK